MIKQFSIKNLVLILLANLFAFNSNFSFAQIPDFSKVPLLKEGDSANIIYLINNGTKITHGKAIAWYPKDSLPLSKMEELTIMLSNGIDRAEKYIHAPLSWQLHTAGEPYTFYFRYDQFISHASRAGFVSIPFGRIKNNKAPWLHEVIHEILYSRSGSWYSLDISDNEFKSSMPLWLFEGLPDYIAIDISSKENWPFFDVFSNSFITDVDSLFVKEIKSEKGTYILSFIGSKGVMPELFSADRALYAPAFYHGSTSFVKSLINTYGIKFLLNSISSFKKELDIIKRATNKSLEILKQEWLHTLGLR